MRQFLQQAAARERTPRTDRYLGMTLAAIAGAINAGGFLAVGRYTSHMTGIASSIADALALHQWQLAGSCAFFLVAFIAGAFTCSLLVNFSRQHHYHSEFASALMLEAVLLLLFGVSAGGALPSVHLSTFVTIALLCFMMGLQNAVISKISHSAIRTTHVTGSATDVGIELGRRLFRALGNSHIPVHHERLLIPSSLLACFLLGAIGGAFSFGYVGFMMVIPLALTLMLLSFAPIWRDFQDRKHRRATPPIQR